jgi:hypothetical protein
MEQDPIQSMLARQVEISDRRRRKWWTYLPRYSLGNLLFATTAMAVGIGSLVHLFGDMDSLRPLAVHGLWFGGVTAIGVGLFSPFRRPVLGAVVGFLIATTLMMSVIAIVIAGAYPPPSMGVYWHATQYARRVLAPETRP